MDPITHGIVGLAVAAVAGEPVAITNPYAIGCLLGAVVPDSDIVMQFKGHYSYLKNHRGASHSIPFAFLYGGVISIVLSLLFPQVSLLRLFLFTLVGSLSHLILDITNSYGAKVFWPFSNKKITTDLLLVYDPILFMLSLAIIVPLFRSYIHPIITISLFVAYLFLRGAMKYYVKGVMEGNLSGGGAINYIRVLPSIVGLLKWHFIIKLEDKRIVGEINVLPRKIRIIDGMDDLDSELYNAIKDTKIAKFFEEFTPISHIGCKRMDEGYEFRFTDLRYYMAEDFLHHATAILDENFAIVSSLFQPYNKSRKVEL